MTASGHGVALTQKSENTFVKIRNEDNMAILQYKGSSSNCLLNLKNAEKYFFFSI